MFSLSIIAWMARNKRTLIPINGIAYIHKSCISSSFPLRQWMVKVLSHFPRLSNMLSNAFFMIWPCYNCIQRLKWFFMHFFLATLDTVSGSLHSLMALWIKIAVLLPWKLFLIRSIICSCNAEKSSFKQKREKRAYLSGRVTAAANKTDGEYF